MPAPPAAVNSVRIHLTPDTGNKIVTRANFQVKFVVAAPDLSLRIFPSGIDHHSKEQERFADGFFPPQMEKLQIPGLVIVIV